MSKTSPEVKNRWKSANYKTYQINLRLDQDAELIQFVEAYKAKRTEAGTPTVTDIFRAGIQALMNSDEN